MLNVNEIFTSIQGEGCNVGKRANFIRLSGCNLNCSWCDTSHTYSMTMAEHEIVLRLNPHVKLVVITGGEPLLQDVEPLVKLLLDRGYIPAIETNGTQPISGYLSAFCWIACAPKMLSLPIPTVNEYKFVVDDKLTLDMIVSAPVGKPIWLQPLAQTPKLSYEKARQLQQAIGSAWDVRIGMQLHRILMVQ